MLVSDGRFDFAKYDSKTSIVESNENEHGRGFFLCSTPVMSLLSRIRKSVAGYIIYTVQFDSDKRNMGKGRAGAAVNCFFQILSRLRFSASFNLLRLFVNMDFYDNRTLSI